MTRIILTQVNNVQRIQVCPPIGFFHRFRLEVVACFISNLPTLWRIYTQLHLQIGDGRANERVFRKYFHLNSTLEILVNLPGIET